MNKIKILLTLALLISVSYCHKNCHFKRTPKDDSILERRNAEENAGDRNLQNAVVPQKLRIKYDVSGLNTIIDPSMKVYLEKTIKVATDYFNDFITVKQPVTTPIKIKNPSCHSYYSFSDFQMKQSYEDADLLIFVTYVVDSNDNYVAYASGCQQDDVTGRNTVGMVNFNAFYMKPDNNYEFQNQLQTTIHELFHVIVFDSDLYKFFISPTGQKYEKALYDNQDLMLKLPNIAMWVQDYYNCPSAQGMQLENEGSDGSAGTHWEMSVLYDDTMTSAGDDTLWSGVNNALLLDSGWYGVDLKYEDNLTWGQGKGCEFLSKKCLAAKQFPEFCYVENEKTPTFSFHAKGVCEPSSWEVECMIAVPDTRRNVCYDPLNVDSKNENKESYGSDSRAFFSTIQPTASSDDSNLRCYNNKCTMNGNTQQIEIEFGNETIICNTKGAQVKSTDANMKGSIICPDIKAFCEKQDECTNYCSSNGYCISGKCICLPGFSGSSCECKEGEVLKDGKCAKCGSNCTACSASDVTICSSCESGFFLQNTSCVPCTSPCKTCESSGDYCNTCISNYSFSQNQCTKFASDVDCDIPQSETVCKQCVKGKGLDATGKCTITCSELCNTCSGSATTCTSCPEGQILFENKCVCEDGYFMNNSKQCEICSTFCKICKDKTTCDVCIDLYTLNPSTKQCKTCPQGSYSSNGKCKKCEKNCLDCDVKSTNCITCRENASLQGVSGSQTCSCNVDYFYTPDDGYCNKCGPNGTMDNNECTCKDSFYMDTNQDQCTPCLDGCAKCLDSETCSQCQVNSTLKTNDKKEVFCICDEKYYTGKDGSCVSCTVPCQNCNNKEECGEIAVTYSLLLNFYIILSIGIFISF